MAFQPIVSHRRRGVHAFEALMRVTEPVLPNPGAVLSAAERLGRLPVLGRRIRQLVAAKAAEADALLFINLHPRDLEDDELYASATALAASAHKVVFEITERAHLDDVRDLDARLSTLRELGYRIALDDLGAGYAGLTSFLRLRPDVVKIDMGLVQGLSSDDTKRRLVSSVTELCRGMGVAVVAEGIEERADYAALLELGIDLLQGYAFARPQRELVQVAPECFLVA
jgi:EAL domain-containing protein (putative c-di-GMP-specific phosphodiesterase class I)